MSFNFELGRPFRPFEQLMGVLPAASKELIPAAYRVSFTYNGYFHSTLSLNKDLMDGTESPILDFYPLEFEHDLNGKKQEWEAVVKIPFIDEVRLLAAMARECIDHFQVHYLTFRSSGTQAYRRGEAKKQLRNKSEIFL
jgi:5'-3' exoribonuclease 1